MGRNCQQATVNIVLKKLIKQQHESINFAIFSEKKLCLATHHTYPVQRTDFAQQMAKIEDKKIHLL
jgi:hypothetical protein